MSDEANTKAPLDPATQVAEEMRARLRTLPADQLVEMCAQLLSTYVVEGVLPLSRAAESFDLAGDTAGEETFALYREPQRQTAVPAPPPPQAAPAHQPAQPSQAGQPVKKDETQKDRFTLIELE